MDEMTNFEEVNVTETEAPANVDVEDANSGNGLVVGLCVAAAAVAGGVLYGKVVKPFMAKRKAKKESIDTCEGEVVDCDDVNENDQEPVK